MDELRFYIEEYTDGNMKISCNHIHYAFIDDLNPDDFTPAELRNKIRAISVYCERAKIKPIFIYNA